MQQQLLQQQFLRRPEGNDPNLAYQAGSVHGFLGVNNFAAPSSSMQLSQQSRKYIDLGQQHNSPNLRNEGQNRSQGFEQQMFNPIQQAYLQYAFQNVQQKSAIGLQSQQQMKMGIFGNTGKDQDTKTPNTKVQDLVSLQVTSQSQASSSKMPPEHFTHEKQTDHGHQSMSDQRTELKPPSQPTLLGQVAMKHMQAPQGQQNIQSMTNNPLMVAQIQAIQALAFERNIDLSNPANAPMMAQLIPLMHSRMIQQQKASESNMPLQSPSVHVPKQQVNSPRVANDSSPHANSSSEASGQSSSAKNKQTVTSGPLGLAQSAASVNHSNNIPVQQFSVHGRENQLPPRQPMMGGNGLTPHLSQTTVSSMPGMESTLMAKAASTAVETMQIQQIKQVNRPLMQSATSSQDGSSGNPPPSQSGTLPQLQQPHLGFSKQQLHVLKAQILAFRRLKKGDGTLPRELLQAIVPPALDLQMPQVLPPNAPSNQDRSATRGTEDPVRRLEHTEKGTQLMIPAEGLNSSKEETSVEGQASAATVNLQTKTNVAKESTSVFPAAKEEQQTTGYSGKSDQDVERSIENNTNKSDVTMGKGKTVSPQANVSDTAVQAKKPAQTSPVTQPKDAGAVRKYHGPLFDFPVFTRKHDAFGSSMMVPNNNNLILGYEIKDLIAEEGTEMFKRKREDNIKKIGEILSLNAERKRIRPDLVLRLQIEEKKLQLADVQARIRDEIEQQQQEIMAMPDRPYRKFVRLCERQRQDLARQVQASQKAIREKQLKSIFQWRKKLLEAHWAIRDARTARNRGVAKYHERMLREFSKRKDDDRNKRMEALKNNDVDRYREMLLEQQSGMPGDSGERYAVLSSFLSQTEEYLHKLGSKITATKNQQEVEEAANAAAAAAKAQGLSEEEVRAAASCAREEVMIRNRFSEMNAPKDGSSANKYYTLAHAVNERVLRQPSMLRAGTLRDYQLVGLQWMLSLYNNKLNGILADEMGLGKTVQVMALIAYLMEFKGNYGPHLIIVPNAVLVNWKSELHTWLPSVSCIFYVGGKDQRAKLFSQEVCAMKFNVLVTTYEFIMYDRSKLSKVDWKYIIIDEAQRMKDRESVLARDLDRYRCQRRLLLTGTPLQNDLKELWSLLNLLLPEVFDNRKAFHDWFSKPFQKEGPAHNVEDDWLETEKKVIIIHRLHQILEPFMLRRRVEDVEGSLPPKVSVVLKCRMSAFQSAVYDWIKSTGTIRVDPEDEKRRAQKNPIYQPKTYKTLNNRCMELRKTCNHPLLNYPYLNVSKDFLVNSCGKLWVLDRVLIKLQRTGHRVLLFSTMTKLLDILEEYLQWRRLVYRRIDGTTSLEDRESAIVDFNSPDTDCFIFLLSIRAAGRGLNLQTADTVIIYDPDPNPKNEEQAVARAHRIGQTREVKVLYMEAVVDKISSHQKEDEFRSGGAVDSDDDLAGTDRYIGSIESLIRNNIQQYKIDMADEVINAGRFDQRTTHEERRLTLETLLHDEERYQETVHDVPSLQEVNRMIARSEEEVELFDQMDEEFDWAEEMTRYDQVPKWLRASSKEVNAAVAHLAKKPSKNILLSGGIVAESSEMASESERRRGRPKAKKFPVYTEIDDENGEFSEASSEERNGYSVHEEGELGDEDDEFNGTIGAPQVNKDHSEDDRVSADGYEYHQAPGNTRNNHIPEQTGSSGSSAESQRLKQKVSPSVSSQKFGSLSALDARPTSRAKRVADELEEGEIAVSGDSHIDLQQSGSWIQGRDEGEEEQVLQQPKIKRKRSIRIRPKHAAEKQEEKSSEKVPVLSGKSSQLPLQVDRKYDLQIRNGRGPKIHGDPSAIKDDQTDSSFKGRRNLPSRKNSHLVKVQGLVKSGRSAPPEEAAEQMRQNWESKVMNTTGASGGGVKMSKAIQKQCKNVVINLQRRINKEGHQIIPLLTDLWRRIEGDMDMADDNLLDLQTIGLRVDENEYSGVLEFVSDVQLMLKSAVQYYGFSPAVRTEARKVNDLFFDILKIAFPETDFREARNSVSFSGPATMTASGSSTRQMLGQNKRNRLVSDAEADAGPTHKPQTRGSLHATEDSKSSRSHVSQKEARLGVGSSREQDDPRPLTHPGELVICKKKRKDREKSVMKTGNMSGGPVSPTGVSRNAKNSGCVSMMKDSWLNQQGVQQQGQGWANQSPQLTSGGSSGGGSSVGWANPVKRMRSDAGRRRPSHL
nr:ATP-dependent helicase BRM [Ipomoea batatas]